MAAIIRVKGHLATFDRKAGVWTSDCDTLAIRLNRHTTEREEAGITTLSHLKEELDYERTIAEYVIAEYGGEIVHVSPYLTGKSHPDRVY